MPCKEARVASLPHLVDDILDQLNTSELPSLKNHLDDIVDPLELSDLDTALNRVLPLWRRGGTLYVACRDEVLRHMLTTLIRDALARPGLIIREAVPGSRLDVLSDTLVLSFDEDPPKTPEHFLHLGGMACGASARRSQIVSGDPLCQICRRICRNTLHLRWKPRVTIPSMHKLRVWVLCACEMGALSIHFIRPCACERTKATAPTFQEIYLAFQAFVGIDILVAHNGYAFDFQVLHREARRNGRSRMPNPTVDILPMARSYGAAAARDLRPLCERYDIASDPDDPPALARALALYRVFEAMKKERALSLPAHDA